MTSNKQREKKIKRRNKRKADGTLNKREHKISPPSTSTWAPGARAMAEEMGFILNEDGTILKKKAGS